jgi:hypothetical protein
MPSTTLEVFFVIGDAAPLNVTASYQLQVKEWADKLTRLEQENEALRARLMGKGRSLSTVSDLVRTEAQLPQFG